jgi:hypothetical protein
MWGPADSTRTILINGESIHIRENLWNFLCQVRTVQSQHQAPLWIDALCIDQSVTTERNHQVSVMGSIYSSASLVISWLGLGDEALYKAINWLSEFGPLHEEMTERAEKEREKRSLELPMYDMKYDVSEGIDLERLPHSPVRYSDLVRLYNHEYWTRVWIIQEIVLAQKVHVWCGCTTTYLRILSWAEAFLSCKARETERASEKVSGSPAMKLLHRRIEQRGVPNDTGHIRIRMHSNDFLDLLRLAGASNCGDLRDRVYAILALMDPGERDTLAIRPDYAKTRPVLLLELADKVWNHIARFDEKEYRAHVRLLLKTLRLETNHPYQQVILGRTATPREELIRENLRLIELIQGNMRLNESTVENAVDPDENE